MLDSTANPAQFWRIGKNWPCYLARPFHALFTRISCNTFLESLSHADQPWVGFVAGFRLCTKFWFGVRGSKLAKYSNSRFLSPFFTSKLAVPFISTQSRDSCYFLSPKNREFGGITVTTFWSEWWSSFKPKRSIKWSFAFLPSLNIMKVILFFQVQ